MPTSIIPPNSLRAFPSSGRYLVGVSGGRDSVALLHGLIEAGYRGLIVCHLNHQLRGRSSLADARFVERLASKYDLSFDVDSTDVRLLARKKKMSLETAARGARFAFFAKAARRHRTQLIFLGHHADDLVETLLLNLFRGAGVSGLAGMREISQRSAGKFKLTIVRPLLSVWRSEIDRFVRAHRLRFREDASNASLIPMRNRVRRRILPYLERTFGREVRRNIWRTATIAAEEENFFDTLLPEKFSAAAGLAVGSLRQAPVAMQRRMVHKWLRAEDVSEVGFDLVERVRALLDISNRVARTNLPRDRHVRRRAGKLFLE